MFLSFAIEVYCWFMQTFLVMAILLLISTFWSLEISSVIYWTHDNRLALVDISTCCCRHIFSTSDLNRRNCRWFVLLILLSLSVRCWYFYNIQYTCKKHICQLVYNLDLRKNLNTFIPEAIFTYHFLKWNVNTSSSFWWCIDFSTYFIWTVSFIRYLGTSHHCIIFLLVWITTQLIALFSNVITFISFWMYTYYS